METHQTFYYDQDQNHVKVAIIHYLSTQYNEKLATKGICEQSVILWMVISINEYPLISARSDLILLRISFLYD